MQIKLDKSNLLINRFREFQREDMSALSENNVQNVTNRAFPLRGRKEEEKENCKREKKIANTLVHHAVIYCTNYPSIGLYRDIPSSIISLKLVDKYKNVTGYITVAPR